MTSSALAPGMRVTITVASDCPRGGHTANGMGTVFPTDDLDRQAGEWAVLPDLRDGNRTTCLMLFAEDELTPHFVSLVKCSCPWDAAAFDDACDYCRKVMRRASQHAIRDMSYYTVNLNRRPVHHYGTAPLVHYYV